MSNLRIKVTCFYCGDACQFEEAIYAKMYTRCRRCTDPRLKYEQIELNSYYGGVVEESKKEVIQPQKEVVESLDSFGDDYGDYYKVYKHD